MTVPTYQNELWLEIWKRPGHATFGKLIEDPTYSKASYTRRGNGVGEGTLDMASNYGRLDEILKPDPTAPINARSSLARIFQKGVTGPIAEWLPAEITGADSKDDTAVTAKGADIFSILGYARVEAWDWAGADDEISKWPDWIWGGRNILGDLESAYKPAVTRIYTEATSGTFTIGISFNGAAFSDTNAIAFNASAATVDTELTAELVAMGFPQADIEVSGAGTVANPWRIVTKVPEGEYVFSTNSGGLTGGLALQDRESIGVILPAGWTTSFNPVNNLSHGNVTDFRATDFVSPDPAAPACDTTGVGIEFNAGAGDFPGIQKIVPVKPGGRYYANLWAYSQGGTGSYRFVIRDLYENGIAATPGFSTGTTTVANTWTNFNIPIVTIPDDVDRVIVRFAQVDGVDGPPTFVACMELREGMPPTTWGDIWEQLVADATVDHAPGRVVWELGTSNAPYLTLDFDAVNDSLGNPWLHPEVSITLKRGQNYLRVASECFKQGYEGRIVPDNYLLGTYKFQLYNPGTAGTVLNASNSPVIMGGADVSKRDVRKFLPTFTDWAVEAGGQAIARERSADAIAALGLIEGYTPNQDLGSLIEAEAAAATALATGLVSAQSLTYTVIGRPGAYPLVNLDVFDTINVDDPPDVPKTARRIRQVQLAWTSTATEYTLQLGAESYVGVGAIYEGVNRLLTEFKAIRDRPDDTTDPLNYFQTGKGGVFTISIAAADASDLSKSKADLVCTGVNDMVMLHQAADYINAISPDAGAIWLSEGNFNCYYNGSQGVEFFANGGISLIGTGRAATTIHIMNAPTVANSAFFEFSSWSRISDLTIIDDAFDATFPAMLIDIGGSGDSTIERCNFYAGYGNCINTDNRVTIRSCILEGERTVLYSIGDGVDMEDCVIFCDDLTDPAIHLENGTLYTWIKHNLIFGGKNHIKIEDDGGASVVPALYHILDNVMGPFGAGAGEEGILIDCQRRGFSYAYIHGNQVFNSGIDLGAQADRGAITIIGDPTDDGLEGSSFATESGGSIFNNIVENANLMDGIRLIAAHGTRVIFNYVENPAGHGIVLEGTSDAVVDDNYVLWQNHPTDDDTYDCYLLLDGSNRNKITDNYALQGAGGGGATFFRYAYNISTADCDDNVVLHNIANSHHAPWGTGDYNDASATTINTAATFGENVAIT